jgi:hypothetical protein
MALARISMSRRRESSGLVLCAHGTRSAVSIVRRSATLQRWYSSEHSVCHAPFLSTSLPMRTDDNESRMNREKIARKEKTGR